MPIPSSRRQTMQQLAQQMRQLEQAGAVQQAEPFEGGGLTSTGLISTGVAPLDQLLPGGGIRNGSLVECLSHAAGSGATVIAMTAGIAAAKLGGACVVIDRGRTFFPAAWPVATDLSGLVVVHPANDRDMLWTLEQSLRCSEVAAVVCWLGHIHDHAYRRLQLAVEAGGGAGFLLRGGEYLSQPSWAGTRLLFEAMGPRTSGPAPVSGIGAFSAGRLLRIELIHCRGRAHGDVVELEINDETGDVRLASGLAGSTAPLRPASL